MAYQYTNKKGIEYYLHKKDVILKGSGKKQTIYFFSKIASDANTLDELPQGFKVKEIQRTGLPVLQKKA